MTSGGSDEPTARRMHQAVAGKPGQHVEIAQAIRPRPDDDVAVQVVLVIQPWEGCLALRPLEFREAVRQRRPDHVLEVAVIRLHIVGARLGQRRHPTRIALAFGPEGQTLGVFQIGQRFDLVLAFEIVLEATQRFDWRIETQHCTDFLGPRAGGIHVLVRRDSQTGGADCGSYLRPLSFHPRDIFGDEMGAEALCLLAQPHQHRIRVQPAVIGRMHRRPKIADIHRRKLVLDLVRGQPDDVAAHRQLGAVIGLEHVRR